MMIPSRREFVASIAAVPFLPQVADAQGRAPAAAGDPVLDQILADLRDLSAELEAQPGNRKATLRATESMLGVAAAHLGAHYDADFRQALRRAQSKRSSRASLIQDLVGQAHDMGRHSVTFDAMDAAMTRLNDGGFSGAFRDVQQITRKVRLQAPEQIQAAAARTQWDYCSDLRWMIDLMETMVALACGFALLEPSPGGEIVCGALMFALGLMYLERAIFC